MAGVGKASTNIESIAGVLISGKVPTTAAGGASNVAIINVSGQVPVTAGNAPLPVLMSVSGDVRVTGGNVNLPVNIANVSGQVPVTADSPGIRVNFGEIQASATTVSVRGGSIGAVAITQISGGALTGSGISVSVNNPGAAYIGTRGDAVFNAAVSNPVKFAKLPQVAGAVCADIVAGVASRKIRVLGAYLNSTGTATAIFMTTGASAALTPKIAMNTGFVLPVSPHGWFETAVGSALSLQIEGGSIGGIITYQEVV